MERAGGLIGSEAKTKRLIAVNASGSNDGAYEAVVRAAMAVEDPNVRMILVGQLTAIQSVLGKAGREAAPFDVCTMDRAAVEALSRKQMAVVGANNFLPAGDMMERKVADVLVSGGQTERLIAIVQKRIGLLPHLTVPSIAVGAPRPGMPSQVVLDVGARYDRTVEAFIDRTILGVELSRARRIEKPRVGLANMGTEPKKGPPEIQEARRALIALAEAGLIDFADNVEGSTVGSEKVDVIAVDGYTGNIILKLYEHQMRVIGAGVRGTLKGFLGWLGKGLIGRRLRKTFDPYRTENQGGTDVVGLPVPVIAFHGGASELEIVNALKRAAGPQPNLSGASAKLASAKDLLRSKGLMS